MSYYRKAPVYFYGSFVVLATVFSCAAVFFAFPNWLGVLGCLGIGVLATRRMAWLKKKFAVSADELYSRDHRAPVLYLRSFNDDEQFKANNSGGLYFNNNEMFEESLVHALKELGPVMAIGRPNEPLPPLGAARTYVGDDGWKDKVANLIRESSLIVLVLGRTAGLGWEISTVRESAAWHKTLFVFPPTSEPDLVERWRIFRSVADPAGGALPESIPPTALFATGHGDGSVTLVENPKVRRGKKKAKYRWSSYVSALRPLLQQRSSPTEASAAPDPSG